MQEQKNVSDPDWVQDVSKELFDREHFCQLRKGPNHYYKRPEKNPFSYKDVNEFKKEHPFQKKKDCEFIPWDDHPISDPNNRFFYNIKKNTKCYRAKGTWKYKSLNRSDRYTKGVCWKTPDDAYCSAKYEVPALLRPGLSKPEKDRIAKSASQRCNLDERCKWVKMRSSQDCFSKEAASKISRNITNVPDTMPKDITKDGIEEYLYNWYVRGIPSASPMTSPLTGEGNRCKSQSKAVKGSDIDGDIIEDHNEPIEENAKLALLPSIPQSVINMVLKNIVKQGDENTNRGLLALHSTGSGKTCTAAGVMDAVWESKKDIVFATSLDALASNPDVNFHECLYNLYPKFQKGQFKGVNKEESLRLIGNAFERRGVRFLSFAKLSNRVKKSLEALSSYQGGKQRVKQVLKTKYKKDKIVKAKLDKKHKKHQEIKRKESIKAMKKFTGLKDDDFIDLNNTVLIIDEVHNLFRPLPTQKQQHDYLKKKLQDPTLFPGLKLVILTATPGDNVDDVLTLLNMIRDPTHSPIKQLDPEDALDIQRFKKDIRGLVSFFDLSGDRTRFPVVTDNESLRFPMSDAQFEKYAEAYQKTAKDSKATNYDKLASDNQLNKFWAPARKYSNMMYTLENYKMDEFGSKIPGLLENIASFPKEKHYVYSAFYENRNKGWSSHGILAIANFMEKELGYTRLTIAEAKSLNASNKVPADKKKRFILVTQNELSSVKNDKKKGSDDDNNTRVLGTTAGLNLKQLLKQYNHPENKYGEYVHVMLASQGFNEGIDLKAVRHIHIFEPLLTMASDKQTIGRAARFCSHGDLDIDQGEWTVQIHRYMSDFPLSVSVNSESNKAAVNVDPGITDNEKTLVLEYKSKYESILIDITKVEQEYKAIGSKARGDAVTEKRNALKTQLKELKSKLKAIEIEVKIIEKAVEARMKQKTSKKKTKKTKQYDASTVELVDDMIYKIARERVKTIMTINQCMKEAAIDCRILKDFHAHTGRSVECASYLSSKEPLKSDNANANVNADEKTKSPYAKWVQDIIYKNQKK
jgi:pyrimidine operon attenuation protein/uracil phosphoribosyltransferase